MTDHAPARLQGVTISLNIESPWSGEAFLDEDAARSLRDDLNVALTTIHARAMHERSVRA